MLPLQSERLIKSVSLKNCGFVDVVEWKKSFGKDNTGVNELSTLLMSHICWTVKKNISAFIESKKLGTVPNSWNKIEVSLLPWNPDKDGTSYRNLNDINYRFYDRNCRGCSTYVYGLTNTDDQFIYLMNSSLDERNKANITFVKTFAHEMFHAMLAQVDNVKLLSYSEEENVAKEFEELIIKKL